MQVGKYLKHNPRFVAEIPFRENTQYVVEAYSDAIWAGCHLTRKSTSGGVLMMGIHVIKVWSSTHSMIALSSAESELYATVKSVTDSMGILAMISDFRRQATVRMHVHACAALGVIQRQGIGKIRHLATSTLFLQSQKLRRVLSFKKINCELNPNSALTKYISKDLMNQHMTNVTCEVREGRAEIIEQLHKLRKDVRQKKAELRTKRRSLASDKGGKQ